MCVHKAWLGCAGTQQILRVAAVVVLAGLLASACGGNPSCGNEKSPYRRAQSRPLLQSPPPLAEPDRSALLSIPETKPVLRRASSERRCIDEPPSYYGPAGTVAGSPEELIALWAESWSARDADSVVAAYATSFDAGSGVGAAEWLERRREQVATGPVPAPAVEGLEVTPQGADRRLARFVQRFGSNAVRKEVQLVREGNVWRISAERVVEVL